MYKKLIYNFFNLFFPITCLACQEVLIYGERSLCTYCLATLPQTSYHGEEDSLNEVVQKFYGRVPVWRATALFKFTKQGYVQNLLYELKYKGQSKIAKTLGEYYGLLLRQAAYHTTCHAIVPVPLHHERLHKRGYNQSFLFGQGLAKSLALPCYENCLIRMFPTATQTKKTRHERWNNVKSAFIISNKARIKGKHILLVDDLITTGATLTACSKVLFEAGARDISIVALAVAY